MAIEDAKKAEAKFRKHLAKQTQFAGWTGVSWQDQKGADRFATRVADKYIDHFTDELIKMGVLPYTGVEVNFSLEGISPDNMVEYIKSQTAWAQEKHIYHTTAAKHAHYIRNTPFPSPDLPESKDEFLDLARLQDALAVLEEIIKDIQHSYLIDETARTDLRKILDSSLAQYLDPEYREHLAGYCRAYKRFDTNTHRVGGLIRNNLATQGEFTGRIYKDAEQVEVATPPKRPIATVRHVNALKEAALTASYEYEQLYRDVNKSKDGEDQPVRKKMAQQLRDANDAFNVYMVHDVIDEETNEEYTENSGEHLSISLLLAKDRNYTDISGAVDETGKGNQAAIFREDNLFTRAAVRMLYQKAYERFLPDASLLALGNVYPLTDYRCDKMVIRPKYNSSEMELRGNRGAKTPEEASRLEIRSFNNASSNISLSMLAVLAVTYAVTREINENKNLSFTNQRSMVTLSDLEEVMHNLDTKYYPNETVPTDLDSAERAFMDHCIVPRMMREFVEETMPEGAERDAAIKEITDFEQAVVKRMRLIDKECQDEKAR